MAKDGEKMWEKKFKKICQNEEMIGKRYAMEMTY
jgi:hypothetical protein